MLDEKEVLFLAESFEKDKLANKAMIKYFIRVLDWYKLTLNSETVIIFTLIKIYQQLYNKYYL